MLRCFLYSTEAVGQKRITAKIYSHVGCYVICSVYDHIHIFHDGEMFLLNIYGTVYRSSNQMGMWVFLARIQQTKHLIYQGTSSHS